MNFDYGSLLTRTLTISWKHKVLWAILSLQILLSLAALPIMFAYIFILEEGSSQVSDTVLGIVGIIFFMIFSIAGTILYAFSSSAVTLGIIRAERGNGSLNFMTLLKDGLAYFWRQLALFLIVQLSIVVAFLLFFVCIFASSVVTMGLASICLQPITILLTPLMFLGMGVLEAACASLVEEDLGTLEALKRGLNVVREHIWKYVLITVIVYIITSILSSLVMFPIFLPFFFLMFGMDPATEFDSLFPWIMGGMFCLFLPIMSFVSVISQTLLKTCLTLTYLQLTQRTTEEQAVPLPGHPES